MVKPEGGADLEKAPKKTELEKLKAENKKLKEDKKKLAGIVSDDLDVTVHYRESKGIHKMLEDKAKVEGLSVSLYVRKVMRAKCGLGSL
jgi:hypothetical protein